MLSVTCNPHMLTVVMLSVICKPHMECHYAECIYAECRGAEIWRYKFYVFLRLCQKKPKVNLIHILRL
jgi:hypothetical protein